MLETHIVMSSFIFCLVLILMFCLAFTLVLLLALSHVLCLTLLLVLRLNSLMDCHTPFREIGNKASIRVPMMFKSHAWQQYDKQMQCY
jgi:hypothetical protein